MRWAVLEPFVALKSSNLLNFKAISCKFVGWQCCPKAKFLPKGKNFAQRQGLTSNRFTFETPAAGGGGGSSLDTVLKNSIIANDRRGNVDKGEVVQCGNARARGKRFTKGTITDPRERNLCRLTRELIFWFGRNGLTPPRGPLLPLPAVSWSPGGDACQDWPPGQNIPTKSHICPPENLHCKR